MRDLQEHGVEVGMESTGVCRIPIWRILPRQIMLKLIYPYFIGQLPSRKTDVNDSEWFDTVIQKNMERGIYIPG